MDHINTAIPQKITVQYTPWSVYCTIQYDRQALDSGAQSIEIRRR